MERMTRRQFIPRVVTAIGLLVTVPELLAACAKGPETVLPKITPISNGTEKGPYALTEEPDGSLTDGRLTLLQHAFVEAVKFSFNPNREPPGSLVLDATFKQNSEFRLISNETDRRQPTNPGLIYCLSTREKVGAITKYPVIRFAALEEYLISLGFKLPGEDCLKTYQDMLTYYITRDAKGLLHGRMEGLGTYNPDDPNFKPRDREAIQYFDRGCLT